MPVSAPVIARLLAAIDRAPAPAAGRALVLGDPAPWRAPLAARGFRVEARDTLAEVSFAEGSLDLVVVAGWLEREPWDRWALQLAHHALADGGRLALAVPAFHGLAAPDALGFLAGRALRALGLRARRALGRPAPRGRFAGRRYRAGALVATLERLGFRVVERATADPGWLAPLGGIARGLHGTHLMLAERGPDRFGSDPRRPWPDPAAHRAAYRRSHGRHLDDLERWLARHPERAPRAVGTLDPECARGRDVLVLCPHPDDELIGCGGTLAKLVAAGARVTVVHATDGSEAASLWHAPPELRRTVRLEEARRVGEAMGFASLVFWREDNAAFAAREERVRELASLLERLRPALVFTPFVTDIHPDHRVMSRLLARAIAAARDPLADTRVLAYAVWSAVPANLVCDITDVVGRLEQALRLYATAMKVDDYVHFCQDRNYHDAVAVAGRPGYVECFFAGPAREFPDLVATVEGTDA